MCFGDVVARQIHKTAVLQLGEIGNAFAEGQIVRWLLVVVHHSFHNLAHVDTMLCEVLGIDKTHNFAQLEQLDFALFTVTVLGNNQAVFHHARNLFLVDEKYDVGVLFDCA